MSFGELLFLAILALLVFGPRKLPEIARTVGKVMTDLRRAGNEFRYSLEDEIRRIEVSEHAPAKTEPPPVVEGAVAQGACISAQAPLAPSLNGYFYPPTVLDAV